MNPMKPMCETKIKKWGYKITNPVTGTRVCVGPFINRETAESIMKKSYGKNKRLCQETKFDFTPTWNEPTKKENEYNGEDIIYKNNYPEFGY